MIYMFGSGNLDHESLLPNRFLISESKQVK